MTKFKDVEAWLEYGYQQGWVRGFCATHDIYENASELEDFEAGWDPCVPVYRLVGLDGNTTTNLGAGFSVKPPAPNNGQQATRAQTTKKP